MSSNKIEKDYISYLKKVEANVTESRVQILKDLNDIKQKIAQK